MNDYLNVLRISLLLTALSLLFFSCDNNIEKHYYPNGQLESIGGIKNGLKEGEWKFYYQDGQLGAVKYYSNDKLDSIAIEYWNHLEIKELAPEYDQLMNFDSTKSLNIKSIKHYRDGRQHGKEIFYFKVGDSRHCLYVNDTLEGPVQVFFKTGELESQGSYVKDKLEGEYNRYYKNGKLFSKEMYVNDQRQGLAKAFFRSGKTKWTVNYVDDRKQGEQKWLSESGNVEAIHTYKDGSAHGEWKSYQVNGKLKSLAIYEEGKQIGSTIEYDESGKVTSSPKD
ncbi:MAG: toxin-antitoxin system YwqK family antitoxin [Bacteroidota bacterium]